MTAFGYGHPKEPARRHTVVEWPSGVGILARPIRRKVRGWRGVETSDLGILESVAMPVDLCAY